MELRRYLAILRRRIWLILAMGVVGVVAGWQMTSDVSLYTATSQVYVGSLNFAQSEGSSQIVSNDRLVGVERIATTFAVMVDSYPIAEDAIERTGAPRSPGAVVAETAAALVPGTQLLFISVTDPQPAVAKTLADGLAEALVARAAVLEPPGSPVEPGAVPKLPANVFANAILPLVPEDTGLTRNVVLAGVFGLLMGAALVFLLDYLDVTLRSADDAEERLGLPVLGVIPLRAADVPAVVTRDRGVP